MVKKDFNWNKSTWTVDYEMVFTNFKKALVNATKLFYPDYDLEWILRVDASDVGVGYVLFQVNIDDNNSIVHQPITFGSKKFSPAAAKWSVYDKEAYAMFFGVLDNQYYLRAKHFILEGDHRNLQWIEKSLTPRVIRWRVFLQGFSFMFRHISGALNKVADWQSRFGILNFVTTELETCINFEHLYLLNILDTQVTMNQLDLLRLVHGGRSGHFGVRRTWKILNEKYAGHGISLQHVGEFIAECPVCQKVRHGMQDALTPTIRNLRTDRPRRVVGMDYLSLETDKNGNSGCYVIKDFFTKFVSFFPVTGPSAINAATALFMYACRYGLYEALATDPGSEFISSVLEFHSSSRFRITTIT